MPFHPTPWCHSPPWHRHAQACMRQQVYGWQWVVGLSYGCQWGCDRLAVRGGAVTAVCAECLLYFCVSVCVRACTCVSVQCGMARLRQRLGMLTEEQQLRRQQADAGDKADREATPHHHPIHHASIHIHLSTSIRHIHASIYPHPSTTSSFRSAE